jgi:Na+-driven multidrug efflux pump
MINGFGEVIGRIGFALILVHIPAVGVWAVWGTTCLTWVLTAVMSVARYKGGKWRNKVKV